MPRSIDQPPGSFSAAALLIDVLLPGSFAVQHSVMARPRFKRVWTRVIPEPIGEGEEQVSRSCPGRRSTRIASLRDSPRQAGSTMSEQPGHLQRPGRPVTVAATQAAFGWDSQANIARAEELVRAAAARGAQIILLPELFETPYFCIEQDARHLNLATTVAENRAVRHFAAVARELGVVLPISFFERAGRAYFNSIAILDADGTNLGVYRKSHIPNGPGYQEKTYFAPGDTGFKVWATRFARIGVGICWDQWFPETARVMALMGAELFLFPTAIGSGAAAGATGELARALAAHPAGPRGG